jgi:formate hydrogenlyase subunit 3/multisubunit Na+/H+ antiporter MnhD subunit
MGYLVMADVGAAMLGIGLGTPEGVQAALVGLVLRGAALPLWALGLDRVRSAAGGTSFESLQGVGRRHPVAVAAVVMGLLSVAGFPLTAGFAGRWALLRLLAQQHPTAAIVLVVSTASAALVCARALAAALQPALRRGEQPDEAAPVGGPAAALYALGFVVLLTLGLFPQWVLPAVANAAGAFTVIGR